MGAYLIRRTLAVYTYLPVNGRNNKLTKQPEKELAFTKVNEKIFGKEKNPFTSL